MAFDDDLSDPIADGWTAPRGPLGGYVMAVVLHALQDAVGDPARQPRSLSVHFVRPARVGPAGTRVTIERTGRALTSASARLEQDGKLLALGIGAFSGAWDAPAVGGSTMPAVAPPSERAPLPVGGPLLARFRTTTARDGFFEEDGDLWARDGTLVAQSRQLGLLLSTAGPSASAGAAGGAGGAP